MRLETGDKATRIVLPSIDGTTFDTNTLMGKRYLLSFLRFAACPFCNLRVHRLVERFPEFGDDFTIVAVFDSPIDNLIQHATRHAAPFPIVADEENRYYLKYGVERSFKGVVKAIFLRMPAMFYAMFKGYLPTSFKGSIMTMPVDFLVDEEGIIRVAHYGEDEGDHLSIDEVKRFAVGT